MRKKIIYSVSLLITLFAACKKNTSVSQQKGKIENSVPFQNAEKQKTKERKKPAISDSAGVYTQSFILEKGKTYPFTTLQKEIITLTAPTGESQKLLSESLDEITFTVEDIVDNIYNMNIHFNRKKTSQTSEGKTVLIDTKHAAPKDENLKKKWMTDKALTGNTLKMKMEVSGKILSIEGFQLIYTKVSDALNKIVKDHKIKEQLLEETKQRFNEPSLIDQFSKNILILPTKGAKIGEEWKRTEDLTPDGKVKLHTTYILKKVENGMVEISVKGGIPRQSQKQKQNGITYTVSSEMSQSGTLRFLQTSGWIDSQNILIKTVQKESMTDGKKTQSMISNTQTRLIINP
ncbi:MAG: hypothetical protein FDW93_06885 [Bergeyella sp.]|nr:hypothetical protein [Bergeyella sp.]